jgi:cytochrome c553
MPSTSRASALVTILVTLAASPVLLAQDLSGEQLFETCLGCHGIKGYKNNYPTYKVPMLGGQNALYIVDALTQYKNGVRKHETMQAQAHSLSDADMQTVAQYLSSATDVGTDAAGKAPAAAATCGACHGANGKGIAPNFPTIAGQHADYLTHALKAYRSGERDNAIMSGFAGGLDDATIAALAEYFSSQDGLITVER